MTKISVIIPCWNSRKTIESTIQSCLGNNLKYLLEIIVIDDGSSDGSWGILQLLSKKIPKLSVYRNPLKGPCSARNFGFQLSRGEYVQWLDSDDTLMDQKFSSQLLEFERDKSVGVVYSDWELWIWEDEIRYRVERFVESNRVDVCLDLLRDKWMPSHNYLVRRDFASLIHLRGGWNTTRKIAQDREYFTQIALASAKFSYVPGIFCVYHRRNSASVSQCRNTQQRAMEVLKLLLLIQDQVVQSNRQDYLYAYYTQLLLASTYSKQSCTKVPWRSIQWYRIPGVRTKFRAILRNFRNIGF